MYIGIMKHGKEQSEVPMKIIGYCRVSTDKQADHGVSIEAQKAKIEAYCSLYGLELVDMIVDAGFSAKNTNRPGLQRTLEALKRKEADGMIVHKLDRLTRSVRDLANMVDRYFTRGASLISVSEQIDTSTAAGRMVLNLITTVSQWEREAIGERTRTAMSHKKSRGEVVGELPFGYRLSRDGIHIEEDPDEQRAILLVNQLKAEGLSLRQIAARLNQDKVPSRGQRWHPTTVVRILKKQAA
jgi:DNA invertase Pin-like site-specific DNA recombinase